MSLELLIVGGIIVGVFTLLIVVIARAIARAIVDSWSRDDDDNDPWGYA